jgi:hypothetical protein
MQECKGAVLSRIRDRKLSGVVSESQIHRVGASFTYLACNVSFSKERVIHLWI